MVAVVVAGCRVHASELGETVSNCPLRVLLKTAAAEPLEAQAAKKGLKADAALAGEMMSERRVN